ncbi:hypothetical protein HYC85_031275 [Camellia sinensis]|uniref:FLZ-type domain-containing protein n=1 Tax=Camellia sinensis TaxID=4442 RepID=A0A7J7FQD1_CAMSI|nr:hypothetical protein HYC85_031275 [Camellia sinensis]
MPVKRSLIGRSSSFGDSGVLSPPIESADGWLERRSAPPSAAATAKPPSNSSKAMKPSVAEKSLVSPPRILTLSSPVQEESIDGSDDQPIGEFLDKCYYCKKKIGENAAVFMYSYLRAFCTAECRDRQIAMDNGMENASVKSEGMQISPT